MVSQFSLISFDVSERSVVCLLECYFQFPDSINRPTTMISSGGGGGALISKRPRVSR